MDQTLIEWMYDQVVRSEPDVLWNGAWGGQVRFFRDELTYLVGSGLVFDRHEKIHEIARVIGTHRSKSILLPVVEYRRPDLGLRMVIRGNFYNYKLSVLSERRIVSGDFGALFQTDPPPDPGYTGDPLRPVYFEGFPEELVFGYYAIDQRRWSAAITSDHSLWTTMFLVMRSLGGIQSIKWGERK